MSKCLLHHGLILFSSISTKKTNKERKLKKKKKEKENSKYNVLLWNWFYMENDCESLFMSSYPNLEVFYYILNECPKTPVALSML